VRTAVCETPKILSQPIRRKEWAGVGETWVSSAREVKKAALQECSEQRTAELATLKKALTAEQEHEADLIRRIEQLDAALKAAQHEGEKK
jgi:uncharacterized protein YlxW (UPF0749 family)